MPSSTPIDRLSGLTFEELEVGQVFEVPRRTTVTEAKIITFAWQWDPQPFHIDQLAAKESVFGQIVARRLQTISLSYWLYYDFGLLKGTAVAGIGMDEIRFLKPLCPGDTISVQLHITEKRFRRNPAVGRFDFG